MYYTGWYLLQSNLTLKHVIIICGYIFVFFITYKYLQLYTPWKINLIVGKKGSGKSTYAAALMLAYTKKKVLEYSTTCKCWNLIKVNIYSNMHTTIPGVRYISNPEDLGKFVPEPYSVLILDEVNTLPGWDNREFKETNKETINFFRYCRQHRIIMYCFTQVYDIDKKLRSQTDGIWLCKKVMSIFTIIRKIDKYVDIDTNRLDADQQLVDQIKFAPWWIPGNVKIQYIPRYTCYFNSYNPPHKPYFLYTVETLSQEKKKKKLQLQEIKIPRRKNDVV